MIRILFLAANPTATSALQLDEESRAIDLALRTASFRDSFDLRTHWALRYADLPELLLRYEPDIVHFSGHGSAAGEIILEEGQGGLHPVSARALARLFDVLQDNIRCVVLNACFSEIQAQAIAQHIDCVVGMRRSISDHAAIDFAAAFYQALGYGRSVQTAFDLACNRVDLANLAEQDIPQLLAGRTDPRQIFLLTQAAVKDATVSAGALPAGGAAAGDYIEGHISHLGPGSQAAVGKNIHQDLVYHAAQLSRAEMQQVQDLLSDLKRAIDSLDIPANNKLVGEEFAGQLENELTKQEAPPDASVIRVAGNWLLKNIPGIAGTLASLFLNPIVGKVVGAAGEMAVDWVAEQFGSTAHRKPTS